MKTRTTLFLVFLTWIFSSCTGKNEITSLVTQWKDKVIKFPINPIYTIQGKDTINFSSRGEYKILSYVDSMGCISCKLQLPKWEKFITIVDSINSSVDFLFFFSSKKDRDIYNTVNIANFNYPICIDSKDSLNILNKFPSDMALQTFLLDEKNKVIAMGNPIQNLKVRELYLKIIQGEEKEIDSRGNTVQTVVKLNKTSMSMGNFDWQKEQKVTFSMKNIGDKPLIIEGTDTSCGCISVEYSKEPIRPGSSLNLSVIYKADHPEHFSKTVTVYCNSKLSPIRLTVTGDAK